MSNTATRVVGPLLLAVLSIPAAAKCVNGEVTVKGPITPAVEEPVTITVSLQTPKGNYEGSADGMSDFQVTVPFSKWSSFSIWGGERCKNLPKAVLITAQAKGKLPGEMRLKFKGNAILSGPVQYRLGGKVAIDAEGPG